MGDRRVLVNGREVDVPDRAIGIPELRAIAGVGGDRALAEVEDSGTLRQLNEGEVIDPKPGQVYVNLPNFGYGRA